MSDNKQFKDKTFWERLRFIAWDVETDVPAQKVKNYIRRGVVLQGLSSAILVIIGLLNILPFDTANYIFVVALVIGIVTNMIPTFGKYAASNFGKTSTLTYLGYFILFTTALVFHLIGSAILS